MVTSNRFLFILLVIFILLFGAGKVSAQKTLRTNYTVSPPRIDGRVEAGEWQVVDSATQFIQMEPQPGMPATENTTVYITFDSVAIYAAFIMVHSDPGQIVGRIQQRDDLSKSDDLAALVLDTYDDKRKAYVFFVNPLGTQIDMRVNDDGRSIDLNWDTEWESATGLFEQGWIVEMAIPFKSINYRSGLDNWGFNAGRIIRHNSETVYWSGALSDDFRVSQGGMLEGIAVPQRKPRLALYPYSALRYDNPPLSGEPNTFLGEGSWKPEVGLDARIGITSQLDANLTLNPDFATVEGDQEEINLTRWELNFPEKRLFFLEGNDMFSTRINTFYSRRIGDINYGAKVTGKIGNMDMNVLSAHTFEDTSSSEPAAFFTAVRLKQDILNSSTVGLTIVDKTYEGGFSRSFSTDYLLNLGKTWNLTGQYVGSISDGPQTPWSTRAAWFARVAKESNIYHVHVRYSNTGENFKENVNQTGFVRDDDMREVDSDVSYRWWMENKWVKYVSLSTRNNIFWNHQGILRSWYLTQSARLYTRQRISLDLAYNDEFKLYERKYYNHKFTAELGYNTDEWASASLSHSMGKNYDRDFRLTTLSARMKPVNSLALEYSLDILNFEPDPDNNSTLINILTVNYNFTRDMWVRVFAQNNSSIERIYFYGLFGWRFKPPFGAVYLIYTSDDKMVLPTPEKYQSRTFFVKLTYPILIGQ